MGIVELDREGHRIGVQPAQPRRVGIEEPTPLPDGRLVDVDHPADRLLAFFGREGRRGELTGEQPDEVVQLVAAWRRRTQQVKVDQVFQQRVDPGIGPVGQSRGDFDTDIGSVE